MFTEELSGNASKKRQEKAKERRRQLITSQKQKEKQSNNEQQQQPGVNSLDIPSANIIQSSSQKIVSSSLTASVSKFTTTTTDSDDTIKTNTTPVDAATRAQIRITTTTSISSNSNSNTHQNPAVQHAIQERIKREQTKLHTQSAIIIQSYYRAYKSNCTLYKSQLNLLTSRLSDLMKLVTMLKKTSTSLSSSSSPYIPPPSLAIALLHQFLFLTHTTPRFQKLTSHSSSQHDTTTPVTTNKNNNNYYYYYSKIKSTAFISKTEITLLVQLIQYVLLPGILSSNENEHYDPILTLINDTTSPIHGRLKLFKLLRFCMFVMVARRQQPSLWSGNTDCSTTPPNNSNSNNNTTFTSNDYTAFGSFLIQDETQISTITTFLKILLGIQQQQRQQPQQCANKQIVHFCRQIFGFPNIAKHTTNTNTAATDNLSFRNHVMIPIHNFDPIYSDDYENHMDGLLDYNTSFPTPFYYVSLSQSPLLRPISHQINHHHSQAFLSIDLLFFSRSFLLNSSGMIINSTPNGSKTCTKISHQQSSSHHSSNLIIPINAEEKREACISQQDRKRCDFVLNFVLDCILATTSECNPSSSSLHRTKSNLFQCRFFAEILTVPLLTWRLEPSTITRLIGKTSKEDEMKTNVSKSKHPFLLFLDSFISNLHEELSLLGSSSTFPIAAEPRGSWKTILPYYDVPLKSCPAPNILCLLANMVQLGQACTLVNGSNISEVDYSVSSRYFNFLSILIDAVPLGTFSSRQSAVEWVKDGTHLTPIVISPVIRDQCKSLILDSFVRQILNCSIDEQYLKIESTLKSKDSHDLKGEKDLQEMEGSSASQMAAKEAMIDRSKSFWQSNWSKQLSRKFSSIFTTGNKEDKKSRSTSAKGEGKLLNTSTLSRKLAQGGESVTEANIKASLLSSKLSANETKIDKNSRCNYNLDLFFALCRMYAIIISRWGGLGNDDLIKRASVSSLNGPDKVVGVATSKPDPCILHLLNILSFATPILSASWTVIQSRKSIVSNLYDIIDVKKSITSIRSLNITPQFDENVMSVDDQNIGATMLFIFTTTLTHTLIVTDDVELHMMDNPLPIHQIRRCVALLKKLLLRACCQDDITSSGANLSPSHYFGLSLIHSASRVMRDLHDRSSRRAICVPKLWLVDDLLDQEIRRCKTFEDYDLLLSAPVLRIAPFLVSFKRRLRLFERIVTSNRESIQGRNDGMSMRPGVAVNVMRGRVLEDGLLHLNKLGRNLRQRIIVNYVNQAGAKETGVDAGGLFKEFWTDLTSQAFNLNFALFRTTEGAGNVLYPNPSSRAAHGSDSIILFEFLGRILGKALYEGITIQPQFAHFFLSFLRGDYNYLHTLSDLSTLDPALYNNLMFLKSYDGDARDLCLTFTVTSDDFGSNNEVPLIQGGADIDVTNSNKHRYIGLVAKYYVCDRVKEQSEAFRKGLWDVIDQRWLRIFNEPELQVLISGPTDGKIDVNDLKANSKYTGGYTIFDRNIVRFWKVLSSFNDKQQADLLRFVTSCERPPPLGFSSMNPPFTIQRVAIASDEDKLPSASTCFNILKLPTYSSEKVLRDRLLLAISSSAGFELT